MIIKNLVVTAFLFAAPMAMADTLVMTTTAEVESYRDEILRNAGERMYALLLEAVGQGSEVTIEFTSNEDGAGGRNGSGSDNCKVTVRENRGGSAGVSVGGRAVGGGDVQGHVNREFTLEGPCKSVERMVETIVKDGRTKTPDKHN